MMKVYISGQITGLEYQQAQEKFESASVLLSDMGLVPVNPMKNGLPYDSEWEKHMIRDIEMLMGCDAILMLDNWTESRGARIEKKIAEERNLLIMYQKSLGCDNMQVELIKDAIEQTMGLTYEKYTKKGRELDGYFARMIFAHHCMRLDHLSIEDIARLVNRDMVQARRYVNNYDTELKCNKLFRHIATKVDSYLTTYVSH